MNSNPRDDAPDPNAAERDENERGRARALGHNPFASTPPQRDPFLAALERLERPTEREEVAEGPGEPRSASQWLSALGPSQWLDEDERARIASLATEIGDGDRFGLDSETVANTLPLLRLLHRYYFRVSSEGHDNLPSTGPAVLASNHAGLLPFDGAMIVVDAFLKTGRARLPRAMVDRWVDTLPFVRNFFAEMGQVIATRANFSGLLEDGQLVLVFPEGIDGVRKPYRERYKLQEFHHGFVEEALRARVPIVPTAVVGSDDQAPILYDVKPLARWLRIPVAPITPTFPWLGLVGLLPYPVPYRIHYAQPIALHEEYDEGAANDPVIVRRLVDRVRQEIQGMIDRSRRSR